MEAAFWSRRISEPVVWLVGNSTDRISLDCALFTHCLEKINKLKIVSWFKGPDVPLPSHENWRPCERGDLQTVQRNKMQYCGLGGDCEQLTGQCSRELNETNLVWMELFPLNQLRLFYCRGGGAASSEMMDTGEYYCIFNINIQYKYSVRIISIIQSKYYSINIQKFRLETTSRLPVNSCRGHRRKGRHYLRGVD